MKTVDVAIVLAVHNCEATVTRALASVFAQTCQPRRIIVVDDGSTDGTLECVAALVAREQLPSRSGRAADVRLLERPRRGIAAARNIGLDFAANCEFVVFLDAADYWPADFLERARECLATNPGAVACAGDQQFIDANGQPLGHRSLALFANNPVTWTLLHDGRITSCIVMRTEKIRMLNGFSEKLARNHDRELLLRLSLRGPCLHAAGSAVLVGDMSSSSSTDGPAQQSAGDLETWANLLEHLLDDPAYDRYLSGDARRALLFRGWYRAGREALRNGQREQALRSFRAAWRFHRWHHKLLIRFAQTWFSRAA